MKRSTRSHPSLIGIARLCSRHLCAWARPIILLLKLGVVTYTGGKRNNCMCGSAQFRMIACNSFGQLNVMTLIARFEAATSKYPR
ncbi:hypothetical protein M405DRAFT_311437 [Rhizopogon salebrosus TDB-379]|nr:hypothetical protein M405DRAFT_311437 [Rhizopogon salebrosus TDB-379]